MRLYAPSVLLLHLICITVESSQFPPNLCGSSCPSLASYAQLHREIVRGEETITAPSTAGIAATLLPGQQRWLVSVAVEAGLTDRLVGIMSEFFMALLSERALSITSYDPLPPFEAAFAPAQIDWTRRPTTGSVDDWDSIVEPLKYTYRGVRGYVGQRPLRHNSSDIALLYLVNDHRANEFFSYENVGDWPKGSRHARVLFVASNRGRISQLFSNPHHKRSLRELGFRPETALCCAWQYLFAPSLSVRQSMSREFDALHERHNELKIAVTIRVGDAAFHADADTETLARAIAKPYFRCAEQIEEWAFRASSYRRVVWYVTSESLALRRWAKATYGRKVLTNDYARYGHGDCFHERNGECLSDDARNASIVAAAGQLYALSMCHYHIHLRDSGFGRFAAWVSGQWRNSYAIPRKSACGQDNYDRFSESAGEWSGI